jgi:hypothetical protein
LFDIVGVKKFFKIEEFGSGDKEYFNLALAQIDSLDSCA